MTPNLRARLLAVRQHLGVEQKEMAALLLTPLSTYKQWEQGARRTPGVAVVAAELIAGRTIPRKNVRDSRIVQMVREDKRTLQEAADKFSLSKQMVKRILNAHDVSAAKSRSARTMA